MRSFYFLLAATCFAPTVSCIAQNYQTVKTGAETYFADEGGSMRAIRADSAEVDGSDSVFFFQHEIRLVPGRDWFGSFANEKGGSVVGSKAVVTPGGIIFSSTLRVTA